MANTFNAVPDAHAEHSTAFLAVEQPAERLEQLIEEAQLHRGSLRETDGYTIPFREGGSVRITVVNEPQEGLQFVVSAPNTERRDHVQEVITEQVLSELGDGVQPLTWEYDTSGR